MASQKRPKRTSKTRRRTEARRQERAALRAAQEAAEAEVHSFYSDVFMPESSAERAAEVLLERLGGRPFPSEAVELFALTGSRERARQVADQMLKQDPGSLTALTLAADVAHAFDGDGARAADLLDEAAKTADPDYRVRLAGHFGFVGRVAEGLDIIEPLRADRMDDLATLTAYADLLEMAERRAKRASLADADGQDADVLDADVLDADVLDADVLDVDVLDGDGRDDEAAVGDGTDADEQVVGQGWLPAECPCRSGDTWRDCCRPRELAALRRFDDRTRFDELWEAVAEHAEGDPELAEVVGEYVQEWLELVEDATVEERHLVAALATEHAWLVGGGGEEGGDGEKDGEEKDGEEADGEEEDGDDDRGSPRAPLASFAACQSTPPADGEAVLAWDHEFDYGLWLVVDTDRGPGLWVVDILSGARRYISVPAPDRARVVRWSVLLAAVVPVDGVWRTSVGVIHLSPAEGDMLAEVATCGLAAIDRSLARGRHVEPRSLPAPGHQAPAGVAATSTKGVPPGEADLVGKVLGLLLPGVIAAAFAWRNAGVGSRNTDGNQICLVEASIQVGDVEQARSELVAHPDLESDQHGGGLAWWGAEIADDERRAMRAQLGQMYGQDVEFDIEAGLRRWLRGRVYVGSDVLQVEVNSRERLAAFVDVLRDVGLEPVIVKQSSLEPSLDLELRRGTPLPNRAMSETEIEDFEVEWPDVPMPGLSGRSPHRAAKRAEYLPVVESALRELEHDAAKRIRAGLPAPDVEAIRDALGVRASDWLYRVGSGLTSGAPPFPADDTDRT